MKKMFISTLFLSALVGLTNCSNSGNSQNTENQDTATYQESAYSQEAHSTQPQQAPELPQKEPAQSIPEFKFYKVKSGISFTKQDIPKGKKTAFILFDPGCSHCQVEAGQLAKNYSKIKNINIYFVSMNDPALMANFLETFAKELVGKPNVEVLYDRNQEFIQKIHIPKQFPANYIYTAEGKLQTYWDGSRSIDKIIADYTK